jgi:hypothetical protein
VDVRAEFPEALNRRFGATIESLESAGFAPGIVVEWAQYWDAIGERWRGGSSARATRIPRGE